MTKDDLKDGMVCKLRNGNVLIVFNEKLVSVYRFLFLCDYSYNDLLDCDNCEFDIMEVYKTNGSTFTNMLDVKNYGELIWKREEIKEMTLSDIEKLLGYPVKIVKE